MRGMHHRLKNYKVFWSLEMENGKKEGGSIYADGLMMQKTLRKLSSSLVFQSSELSTTQL